VSFLTKGSGHSVGILMDVDLALSASGIALRIDSVDNIVNDLNIVYGADVTISTVAEGPMAEAAVMGAVSRLMGGKGAFRTSQDTSQGDSSVAPANMLQSASFYYGQFLEARRRAKEELLRRGPMRTV
jgi:hypothetical protein